MQVELDPERVQLREEADEVLQAPPQSINAPGHDDIELAAGSIAVQSGKSRSGGATPCPADAVVGINPDHPLPPPSRGLGEVPVLSFGPLLVRLHPAVHGRA